MLRLDERCLPANDALVSAPRRLQFPDGHFLRRHAAAVDRDTKKTARVPWAADGRLFAIVQRGCNTREITTSYDLL
jgi:hypothetical protein